MEVKGKVVAVHAVKAYRGIVSTAPFILSVEVSGKLQAQAALTPGKNRSIY
jgi:hypothetical protein